LLYPAEQRYPLQVNADGIGMDFVAVALLQGVMGVSASRALASGNLDVTRTCDGDSLFRG
jgi:hypothetical protein